MDLSIITATCRPDRLRSLLHHRRMQSISGISIEHVIVQESDTNFDAFLDIETPVNTIIMRQGLSHDYGASAKDRGIIESSSDYILFWDDDNIYYPHAIATLYATAMNHDIGVARVLHQGLTIPIGNYIKAGEIDTMCFCVRKTTAARGTWSDGGGKFSDFRWLQKIIKPITTINYTPIIVGEHL